MKYIELKEIDKDLNPYVAYVIISTISDKRYFGSDCTGKDKNRFSSHLSQLRNNKHSNKDMQNDFNLYGESSFIFVELRRSNDMEIIRNTERRFILNFIESSDIYNSRIPDPSYYEIFDISVRLRNGEKFDDISKQYKLSHIQKCQIRYILDIGKNSKVNSYKLELIKEKINNNINQKQIVQAIKDIYGEDINNRHKMVNKIMEKLNYYKWIKGE